jgi:hypothetical protein
VRRTLFLFYLLIFCSSCSTAVRHEPFLWPATVDYMDGSGDVELSWKGRAFSGSFAIKMESSSSLTFEVYGPFGQTLLQINKTGEQIGILTPEGGTGGEKLFEKQYGMSVNNFLEDIMMKGVVRETVEGSSIDRAGYRVLYSQQKGKPAICWLNPNGSIRLIFSELTFTRDGQSDEGSRK